MDSDKEKALKEAYQKVIALNFNQAPIDQIESYVVPDVMVFGSTVDEQAHDLEGYISIIKGQEEQTKSEGLSFQFETEPIHRRILPGEESALFVDLVTVSFKSGTEVVHQSVFRLSLLMEKIDGQWKLVYLHDSILTDTEGDPFHINEYKKEKERLEQQVAEQTADLQLINRELEIEAAIQRVRTVAMGMQEPDDIMKVLNVIKKELAAFELNNIGTWIWIFNDEETLTQWDISEIDLKGTLSSVNITMDLKSSQSARRHAPKWKRDDYYTMSWKGDQLQGLIDEVKTLDAQNGKLFQEAVDEGRMTTYWQACAPFSKGVLGLDYPAEPPEEAKNVLTKMASAIDMAYQRFEDLRKAEHQAYESKVETSLERIRGMASAMNHSDDLMQIAEAMFRELEILKIRPLRYGLAMIDREKIEAELWASTVNDGHYLDMLGTLSLTWHPMLLQALDAWDSQHEELIYELKGQELSSYYKKIGLINPEIPNLGELQDPETDSVQYTSFFPFKTGVLYAFTEEEPAEEGRSILKRFASVFEQAHIRYNDLQIAEQQEHLIREERDRLEIALKELRATKDQLVQQEKLASLGQLTAGIAHEIKNPLNFVNNFSEVSIEMVEEAIDEVKRQKAEVKKEAKKTPLSPRRDPDGKRDGDPSLDGSARGVSDGANGEAIDTNLLLEILGDIEANLRKIHEHGSRADGIVKSMLQHSRGGEGTSQPTNLNSLVKEYVNLSFHGMRAGDDPINVEIDLQLDDSVGEIPLVAEDFSRVILNVCNNAFDAMREKLSAQSNSVSRASEKAKARTEQSRSVKSEKSLPQPKEGGDPSADGERGDDTEHSYSPKLTVRTLRNSGDVSIHVEDNGIGIPKDMRSKVLQPFFTTKKGTSGTGLGLSITNDIIKAHGGDIRIESEKGFGTNFKILLRNR
ncbi:ATP-binding protein [Rhodohalobacter mucosus]|uniref:histidine kinase n=1 Tax=Rhodohalobacter mucosus TaxID=2079485 RepID=A0A316TPM1_9BACT|nr:ATP-binding protein [Rhodohalobacter mucosus]PWN05768.1 hypothetical protein DDZ15_11255 [Rhodohalobacter mucosus]